MNTVKKINNCIYSSVIPFISFSVLLFLGFYMNFYNVIDDDKFYKFQRDDESYVIGRLTISEKEGVFHKGGLTGRIYDIPRTEDRDEYQYKLYKKNLDYDETKFFTYNSQPGGQAIVFALVDKLFSLDNAFALKLFWIFTSILSSIVFSLFLLWVKQKFGLTTTIVTLVLIILSHWITIFGKNLWWSLWNFYLPFIFFLFFLNQEKTKTISNNKILLITFFTLLLKCFFSGFEYITTTIIMAFCPFIFYAVSDNWSINKLLNRALFFSAGVFTSIISSFVILSYQLSFIRGSMSKGFEHIIYSYYKRTSGQASQFPEKYRAPLDSSVFHVLGKYGKRIAFRFNDNYGIHFAVLVLFLGLLSYILIKKLRKDKISQKTEKKALIVTTWISMLAPLSWFIIFKAHSYVHTHMNPIVWYMPFLLFGFVIIGVYFSSFLEETLKRYKKSDLN